ncbi:hypothetical protein VST7929_02045 [Vibrio stylophorae]|uniref:Flagellar basal-body protein n=1 Tax=Vibrio stylophorae TaxID=659351 RepID=A0ABM8ZUY9_9VIBR|nr:flagella assembly protein FlgT [Vibrio stylophorae]CAH0534144.1 hypothetical protein VST7929_02045 [Vibrio stylophorae]
MLKKIFQVSLSLLLLSLSLPSQAMWYETTGQANILSRNDSGRQAAIEDALYQTIQFAGADLTALAPIREYLAEDKAIYQFSGSDIRTIQVLKSQRRDNKQYVTIRVDLYPTAKSCHRKQYQKTLLLGEFRLVHQQQAALGSIYQVGNDFTRVLANMINKESQSFHVNDITRVNIGPDNPSVMTMLAQDHNSQYLVSGYIHDLTATLDEKMLRDDQTNRQFALTVQVLDGKNGELVYQQDYRDVAIWPFARNSHVDTSSARFWVSSYGNMVQRVGRDILLDLENELACRITIPEIIAIHGQNVQINLGRVHGVKQGDRLELWHKASFIDPYGITRTRIVKSDVRLQVDRVYETSSELRILQPELAQGIQIGDYVSQISKR